MVAVELHSARPNKGIFTAPRLAAGLGGNRLVGGRGPSKYPAGKTVPPGGGFQLLTSLVL